MKFEIEAEVSAVVKELAKERGISADEACTVLLRYGVSRVNALSKYAATHKAPKAKPAKKTAKKVAKKAAKKAKAVEAAA